MKPLSAMKIVVALPAYNEEKYIGSLVLQARQYAEQVIVVDDGSADRTAKVAELAGAAVLRHAGNRGYGGAIQSIFAEAKRLNPDVLVIFDADYQHSPEEIPHLVKPIADGFDLAIGSRVLQNNAIPAYRRFGQRVLSSMTNVLSAQKVSDTESGFRAYSKKAIAALELKETGMAISSEIVSTAARLGLKVTEIPISVQYTGDSSTMNPVRHGLGVANRILTMISERKPLLVFGTIGIICLVCGSILGVLVINISQTQQALAMGTALMAMLFITVGVLLISTGIILNVLIRRLSGSK